MPSTLRAFGRMELLGEGATAEVFRATHGGVPCAVKRAKTPGDADILRAEAEVLRELEGPWFPEVLDEGTSEDGRFFLVTTLAPGAPLDPRTVGAKERPALLRRVAGELARALATLAVAGFAHGDVKPENVIVSATRVSLVDFGLAGRTGEDVRGFSPRYKAPELGGGSADLALADRYALGVVLAELAWPEVAKATDPASVARAARATTALHRAIAAACSAVPLARPSPVELLAALGEGIDVEVGARAALRRARGDRGLALSLLAGPWGASLAPFFPGDDDAFVQALVALGAKKPDPRAWTLDLVEGADLPIPADAVALALALARPRPPRVLVERGLASTSEEVRLAAVDALVRAGSLREALSVDETTTPRAAARAADVARRLGDRPRARALAQAAGETPLARAVLARLSVDERRFDDALAVASGSSPEEHEVRALARMGRGDRPGAEDEVRRGLAASPDEERRARLLGALGYALHTDGRVREAEEAFADAAASAQRAGSAIEEATYLTGVAASAADGGRIGRAIAAAERATAIWLGLGRPRDAARALVAKAAALRTAGAHLAARDAAHAALREARLGGDPTAHAYAALALVDAGETDALARTGALPSSDEDVRLRVRARELGAGALGEAARDAADRAARSDERSPAARLEWWTARAGALGTTRADDVLEELARLLPRDAPLDVRGRAAAAAVDLAGTAGRTSDARAWVALGRELGAAVLRETPDSLRPGLAAVPWVARASAPPGAGGTGEKLADVERLVRSLTERDSVRRLAEQVLDAMVVWTAVERGVLLVPAPEGRLVPRAARNFARRDLSGEQLALSQTLARRALAERRTVVAVDAAGELSDTSRSVHLLKLRSVLAVPLVVKDRVLGVAYLDDRDRRGAFGPDELAWVELAARIAALSLADAFDAVALRRAARKSERAAQKLALAVRETSEALALAEGELRRGSHPEIVGTSLAITQAVSLAERVARRDVPVLVLGESGSGKELFARAIHRASPRAHKKFLAENCAGIPDTLLESTLFGHVRGAFTGAVAQSAGLFATADGGTLFLDEIGEMPLPMQAKLLRVLQDGEVRAVGASGPRKVDVRVVAATHRDLRAMVREGTFREDLFYRLDVVEIAVPPLRDRPGDVPLLVAHFLAKHGRGERFTVTQRAMQRLQQAPWPGNVRQLENELRRAMALSDGRIDVPELSPDLAPARVVGEAASTLHGKLDAYAKTLVQGALHDTRGNVSQAAEQLGLSRFGLQKMMKRLGLPSRGGA